MNRQPYLIVSDIETARGALIANGIEVGEIFHITSAGPVTGLDPERGTYRSRALFSDPDGNSWMLQEITARLPGRIDSGVTSFGSVTDLMSARRRAEAAHGEHEKRTGVRDANWADWYAAYMAAEQAGLNYQLELQHASTGHYFRFVATRYRDCDRGGGLCNGCGTAWPFEQRHFTPDIWRTNDSFSDSD